MKQQNTMGESIWGTFVSLLLAGATATAISMVTTLSLGVLDQFLI